MKPIIKVGYVDFWPGYRPEFSFIYKTLSLKYQVIIDNIAPDFLFFSCFGTKHFEYKNCVKICTVDENVVPNFNQCDYAISCTKADLSGRNLWLPIGCRSNHNITEPVTEEMAKRRFCNFIYSQDSVGSGALYRKQVCKRLMEYKHVDCPGKILHNIDLPELSDRFSSDFATSKIAILRKYKFTIAFENSNSRGYITEKLLDPLIAGSVPIYWGSEGDVAPFPGNCMINALDYPDIDTLIKRIIEVDNNDDLYLSMCRANPLRCNLLIDWQDRLLNFLTQIIERGNAPLQKNEVGRDWAYVLYEELKAERAKSLRKILSTRIRRLFKHRQ